MAPVDPPRDEARVQPGSSKTPAQLEVENQRLIAQLDSLLEFERRHHELQAERRSELELVRVLNDFALDMAADATAEKVIRRSIELLSARFDLEQVIAVRKVEDQVLMYVAKGQGLSVEAEFGLEGWRSCCRWVAALGAPVSVCPWREWETGGALAPLANHVDASLREHSSQVIVPIGPRSSEGMRCFFIIDPRRGPSPRFELERFDIEHLPWVELLASHVHRALQVASLTEDVRARSAELEEKNVQLELSLQEVERQQQQLLQTGKMEAIGRLAGGVAHDFNNLLTVIITCSRLLEKELEDSPEARGLLAEVAAAGDRGATLVRQLLAFSRMQPQNPTAVDLNEVVEEMVQLLRRLIGEDVTLEVRLCEHDAILAADYSQLQQVLMNLVINARDAVSSGGKIVVETLRRPRQAGDAHSAWVALRVSDTGRGMDDETLAQIFEPFFTTKAPGQGTGMGLATVYGIVRQSAGQIDVRSKPGHGATFEIRWPEAPPSVVVTKRKRPQVEPETPSARILLVEDEPAIRRLCERILTKEGHEVITAQDGQEALEALEADGGRIDLLVTDVIMPRVSGAELAAELTLTIPGLRILFITGYAGAKDDERSLAEMGRVLAKPFAAGALRHAVRELLIEDQLETVAS
jgi:signal transduction histidine kinase/CheY-like chemotaxis protein